MDINNEINVPLLRKAVEFIENHPEQFLMSQWRVQIENGDENDVFAVYGVRRQLHCGTVGCLAGTICEIMNIPMDEIETIEAQRLLGIDFDTTNKLFQPNRFDTKYSISELDNNPMLIRDHVESVLGIKL